MLSDKLRFVWYSRESCASAVRMCVCLFVCPSVCLPVKPRYCVKTTQARITKSSPTDSPRTLVLATWGSSRNSKALNESGVGKLGDWLFRFQAVVSNRFQLLSITNMEVTYAFLIGVKTRNQRPWMTLNSFVYIEWFVCVCTMHTLKRAILLRCRSAAEEWCNWLQCFCCFLACSESSAHCSSPSQTQLWVEYSLSCSVSRFHIALVVIHFFRRY